MTKYVLRMEADRMKWFKVKKAERELLKKRIYAAGVMGEKVYP